MDDYTYTSPLGDPYSADPADIENNKIMAILAYLGILVLVPILAAKESRYAMFHANQGLILLIFWTALWIFSFIPIIGLISILGYLFLFVLMIIGIINAAQGKMKPLPLVGTITILK